MVLLASACVGHGDDAPAMGDAAPPRSPDAAPEVTPPALPLRPAVPLLLPCPPGWRERVVDGVPTLCDPWPVTGRAECPAGEAHFPGTQGCALLGRACPTGDFPDDLPLGTRHVRTGAAPGGDGSAAAPYATVAAAIVGALPGTTIALARGVYDERVRLSTGVTLRGACASATTLRAPTLGLATITAGAMTAVEDLTISGASVGIHVDSGADSLRLEGVAIDGATGAALSVTAAADVFARRVLIARTTPQADGRFGRGLEAILGARVELDFALFLDNHDAGVFAGQGGSVIVLRDVAVIGTREQQSDREAGRGLVAAMRGRIAATRVVLERNHDAGALAVHAGSTIVLEDAVVRGTLPVASDLRFGRGLSAGLGGRITVRRGLLDENHDDGAFVALTGSRLELFDTVVRGTKPRASDGRFGRGLRVQENARAHAERVLVKGNRTAGIAVSDPGTLLEFTDLVVVDTESQEADRSSGYGVVVGNGGRVTGSRLRLERNRTVGLALEGTPGGGSAVLEDVEIRGTRAAEATLAFGRGVNVLFGATLDLTRALLVENRDLGLAAFGAGTRVTLTDVAIRDTKPQDCGDSCAWNTTSHVGAYDSALLQATRFLFRGSPVCGLQLASGGTAELSDGEISANQIGVNLQSAPFYLARLGEPVRYVENVINLDATALPLPDPAAPGGP